MYLPTLSCWMNGLVRKERDVNGATDRQLKEADQEGFQRAHILLM